MGDGQVVWWLRVHERAFQDAKTPQLMLRTPTLMLRNTFLTRLRKLLQPFTFRAILNALSVITVLISYLAGDQLVNGYNHLRHLQLGYNMFATMLQQT